MTCNVTAARNKQVLSKAQVYYNGENTKADVKTSAFVMVSYNLSYSSVAGAVCSAGSGTSSAAGAVSSVSNEMSPMLLGNTLLP